MNVNATFFAELLAFSIFIFITYRYLWPSFSSILDERRDEISKGLEAASESQKKLEEAQDQSRKMIEDAKFGFIKSKNHTATNHDFVTLI